jgi:hypothetical protein
MYEGTPELQPVTGPDSDAARATDGVRTAQATAAGNAARHSRKERESARARVQSRDIS